MFQRVTLIGFVGQDPQMRYTPDGVPVANFSVATKSTLGKNGPQGERPCPQGWTESYNGKNWELTAWFRVTAWRGLAETVNLYLQKGSQVYVEGEVAGVAGDGVLNPRVWTDNSGEHRASYEITARTVKFLGKREGNGGAPVGEPPPEGYEEENLPF